MRKLDYIEIEGFKSIKHLQLQLGAMNVLIGQNGAGKSNLISFFRMLNELIEERLQLYVARSGGCQRAAPLRREDDTGDDGSDVLQNKWLPN